MEMVNRGVMSFWVPLSDRENTAITNFGRWEQAFRVFMNIYTCFHPTRAGELIQYYHIIHTASQTYSWENVYNDREFRIHMSRHHLHRSWGVILQQAWSMYLKDKVNNYANNGSGRNSGGNGHGGPRKRICFDFNKGACSYGKRCKFDHRCSFCNKYGHGMFNCRKALRQSGGHGGAGAYQQNGGNFVHNNFHDNNQWDKYEREHVSRSNVNNNNVNQEKKA